MSLDLIQILTHLLDWHKGVVQMALLDVIFGEEVLVVVEGFDFMTEEVSCVIWRGDIREMKGG